MRLAPRDCSPSSRLRELTGGRSFSSRDLPQNPKGPVSFSSRNKPFGLTSPAPLWLFKHFLPRPLLPESSWSIALRGWSPRGRWLYCLVKCCSLGSGLGSTGGGRAQAICFRNQRPVSSLTFSFLHQHPWVPQCPGDRRPRVTLHNLLGLHSLARDWPKFTISLLLRICTVAFPELASAPRSQKSQEVVLQGAWVSSEERH